MTGPTKKLARRHSVYSALRRVTFCQKHSVSSTFKKNLNVLAALWRREQYLTKWIGLSFHSYRRMYLHSGEIQAKLVGFKKTIFFCFIKDTSLMQILPLCKRA